MTADEPSNIALTLTVAGVLMLVAVLFSRPAERVGIPAVLLFLGIGLAGAYWNPELFTNYDLAFRIGTVGLVLILFDGGINTPWSTARAHLAPATVLATFGVALTAILVAVAGYLLGLRWIEALLLGAIVSSTDAAAVFSALRGSGVQLKRRVGGTLELESGLNDPMAVILTLTITSLLLDDQAFNMVDFVGKIVLQLAVGIAAGVAVGWLGQQILRRVRVPAAGLYPVLTVSLAMLAFGLPTLFMGSGFLAVYIAALMLGNFRLPYRSGILRVHDAIAWLAQISMFLVLGLLAVPELLAADGWRGLAIALALALIARPLAVAICLAPFRFNRRETGFIAWVGLRGAVPILLATYPVMAGVEGATTLFHLVFFVVVVNAVLPGATVRWAANLFDVERSGKERPRPVLEINTIDAQPTQIISFYLDAAALATGARALSLPLPEGAAVLLLVRERTIVPIQTETTLMAGDHVHILHQPQDKAIIELLFGLREDDD
jgi:cell volume regulation protein A